MTRQAEQPEFVFALKAIGVGSPEAVRVRKLLKELGRRHGLRVSWPAGPNVHPADENAPACEPCGLRGIVEDEQ